MSIIIHVGPPKTGTTSFQVELWRASNLGTLNAYYPIELDINHLAFQLSQQNSSAIEQLSLIYEKYLKSLHKNFILSAENFSDFGYIDLILYDRYSDYFASMRNIFIDKEIILLYTLTNDNHRRMVSTIIEAIKHGKNFQKQSIYEYILSVPYFSAQRLFDNIIRIFRPTKIEILTLHSYSDIFEKTQDLFDLQFQELKNIPVHNVSLSYDLIYELYQINIRNEEISDFNAIENFCRLQAKDKSYFNIGKIKSSQELFSLIDTEYENDRDKIINYIDKFTKDTHIYVNR